MPRGNNGNYEFINVSKGPKHWEGTWTGMKGRTRPVRLVLKKD